MIKEGFTFLNRFNGLPGTPKTVETVGPFMITGRGHRAEATVLMTTLRVDPSGLFVQSCGGESGAGDELRRLVSRLGQRGILASPLLCRLRDCLAAGTH